MIIQRPYPLRPAASVASRAEIAGDGLHDSERAALAVELIRTIKDPVCFATVIAADALRQTDTIEQATADTLTPIVAPVARGTAGRPRPRSSSLGAVWATIRNLTHHLSESIWGDVLGLICLVGIWLIVVIVGGVLL